MNLKKLPLDFKYMKNIHHPDDDDDDKEKGEEKEKKAAMAQSFPGCLSHLAMPPKNTGVRTKVIASCREQCVTTVIIQRNRTLLRQMSEAVEFASTTTTTTTSVTWGDYGTVQSTHSSV